MAILAGGDSLTNLTENSELRHWRVWHEELRRLGFGEGRNLRILRCSTEGDRRRVDSLVREILGFAPDVVLVPPPDLVEALRKASTTVAIIAFSNDPVIAGFANSLARPGSNVTGFTIDTGPEFLGKRLELLKEAVPTVTRVGALMLRQFWDGWVADSYRQAAQRLGLSMIGAPLDAPVEEHGYRRAFGALTRQGADAVIVSPQSEHFAYRTLIDQLAAEARLPLMYSWREQVVAGGLLAYTIDLVDVWRRAAGYTVQILKGARPAEMPFQQPSKFELIVNLRTAKALDLTIPPSLLARADEVIE